jgi:hypothetical protein
LKNFEEQKTIIKTCFEIAEAAKIQLFEKILNTLTKCWDELDDYKEINEPALRHEEYENINIAMDYIENAEYILTKLSPKR